jgi:hypothetical protein
MILKPWQPRGKNQALGIDAAPLRFTPEVGGGHIGRLRQPQHASRDGTRQAQAAPARKLGGGMMLSPLEDWDRQFGLTESTACKVIAAIGII